MTNFEKYKDEILKITANQIAVTKDGTLAQCDEMDCLRCKFHDKECELECKEWLLEDDGEPAMTAEETWEMMGKMLVMNHNDFRNAFKTVFISEAIRENTPYEAKVKLEELEKRQKYEGLKFGDVVRVGERNYFVLDKGESDILAIGSDGKIKIMTNIDEVKVLEQRINFEMILDGKC